MGRLAVYFHMFFVMPGCVWTVNGVSERIPLIRNITTEGGKFMLIRDFPLSFCKFNYPKYLASILVNPISDVLGG